MIEMVGWESYICVYILIWAINPIFAELNLLSSKDLLLIMSKKELINNSREINI